MSLDEGAPPTRQRLIEATLQCVERWGIGKTSLEDVATAASLSRATVYRHFPGGRDELVHEAVIWQVGAFFARIEQAVEADPGLEAKLVHGLSAGRQALREHKLLHQVLATEPEFILPELMAINPLVLAEVRQVLRGVLDQEELRPGVDPDEAADYLAQLYLSYLGSPGGTDLTDTDAVTRLVRLLFVGGILADQATRGTGPN